MPGKNNKMSLIEAICRKYKVTPDEAKEIIAEIFQEIKFPHVTAKSSPRTA